MQLTTTLATLTIFMVRLLWISLHQKAPILSIKAGVDSPKGKDHGFAGEITCGAFLFASFIKEFRTPQ
jgi:hypothetical protein